VLQPVVECDGPRGAGRVAEQRVGVHASFGPRTERVEHSFQNGLAGLVEYVVVDILRRPSGGVYE
jgi:hypothetical protein